MFSFCFSGEPGALFIPAEAPSCSKEGNLVHFDDHLTLGGIACALSHRLALRRTSDAMSLCKVIGSKVASIEFRSTKLCACSCAVLPARYSSAVLLQQGEGGIFMIFSLVSHKFQEKTLLILSKVYSIKVLMYCVPFNRYCSTL